MAMKSTTLFLFLFLLLASRSLLLPAKTAPRSRGGIEFSMENAELIQQEGETCLSLDIMASSPDSDQRLGTGIVLLNYNPDVFGYNVRTNNNVSVSPGELLSTEPFPFYGIIINDNSATRLAVTYEYTAPPGYGGLLDNAPEQLFNVRFKVQSAGFPAGISFQQDMMANQQFMDDNATLFDPVTALDEENGLIPSQPENLCLTFNGNNLILSWSEVSGCLYNVWSVDDPASGNWIQEASGLSDPVWNCLIAEPVKFLRVTAFGDPGLRK